MTNDRLAILIEQLDSAWEMFDARLTGRQPWSDDPPNQNAFPTEGEVFWEPATNCWSLRRRGEAKSPNPTGAGEWVLDGASRRVKPPPFTTIAWRICHMCVSPLFRYDYTFGNRSLTMEQIVWPGAAREMFQFLHDAHVAWRDALANMDPADAGQVGLSQFPGGLDPTVRFIDLVAWTNLEFAHHAAEVACVRDLYRATRGRPLS